WTYGGAPTPGNSLLTRTAHCDGNGTGVTFSGAAYRGRRLCTLPLSFRTSPNTHSKTEADEKAWRDRAPCDRRPCGLRLGRASPDRGADRVCGGAERHPGPHVVALARRRSGRRGRGNIAAIGPADRR